MEKATHQIADAPRQVKHDFQETSVLELERIFRLQREAFSRNSYPSAQERRADLTAIHNIVKGNAERIIEAIEADFGSRSHYETRIAEIFNTLESIRNARWYLKKWMRPRHKLASIWFQPGRAKVLRQPLGVVGIIGPWNYPVMLAVQPMIAALAAGNRVMLKMSEFTPRVSALFADLIGEAFLEDKLKIINGGSETGIAMTHLPFDHLMYTGSNARGREIMRAASENMTPVTLEMGGKGPAIIHPEFPTGAAAERILASKMFNAGQTCIAADYVMIHEDKVEEFVAAAQASVAKMFPSLTADYTSIINDAHYQRLLSYLDEARAKGARLVEINPANEVLTPESRRIAPTLILDTTDEMLVVKEEIFGPLLPIITYINLDDAKAYVNAGPRPLALYYFDNDWQRINSMLRETISGGVTINDAMWHFCVSNLPFGGVGSSGIGHYHGEFGFNTFSHQKAVFVQSRFSGTWTLNRPYGWLTDFMLKLMIR